ncbi:serine hydrolase [Streptomyces sp. JV185]|uniref:serine hydrolase n=1 Tax=Streptomyces sp. JV185 TaxID=858638 RepID=UPI002E79DCBF|nr:serine hydrolase [Streptomyces sp. JV185]MEE1766771.1 serine hydrolase [Streptomyces sp. JV185]
MFVGSHEPRAGLLSASFKAVAERTTPASRATVTGVMPAASGVGPGTAPLFVGPALMAPRPGLDGRVRPHATGPPTALTGIGMGMINFGSCRTTAAEMTRLLRLIRRGKAAAREACADVRRWLELQVWPHRLRSGCPDDEMRTSGKTGTLPAVRNEVGVVEYPDGGRYSVAVFTRAEDARSRVPERDAFIGLAAATAVESLRPA